MVKSYLSDKIEVKESETHKKGMFAQKAFHKGEVAFVKGGHILTREQIFSTSVINSYHPISDNLFLGATNAWEKTEIPPPTIKRAHNRNRFIFYVLLLFLPRFNIKLSYIFAVNYCRRYIYIFFHIFSLCKFHGDFCYCFPKQCGRE